MAVAKLNFLEITMDEHEGEVKTYVKVDGLAMTCPSCNTSVSDGAEHSCVTRWKPKTRRLRAGVR